MGAVAVQVRAANETVWKLLVADVQTDHDMADMAVVEHPHPHEDQEHVEWEHPVKEHFDEDDGTSLGSGAGPRWC